MVIISKEQLNILNTRLSEIYGRLDGNQPYFRVVWSEDQLEKRLTYYSNEGFALLHPEVRELPKYKQWVSEKYLLEGLTVVPQIVENDLVTPLSYEPIWVFEDKHGNALEPKWSAIHWILETIKKNTESPGQYTKYKDPDSDPKEAAHNELVRLQGIESELFGNETSVSDALAYDGAIVVPPNYNETTQKKDE